MHDAVAAIALYEHELGQHLWSALEGLPGVKLWGVDFSRPMRVPRPAAGSMTETFMIAV